MSEENTKHYLDGSGVIRFAANVIAKLNNKSNVDHTHDIATTEKSGFMSAMDKAKLDDIDMSNFTVSLVVDENEDAVLIAEIKEAGDLLDKPAYAAIYGGDALVFGRGKSAPETYEGKALTEAYDSANGYDIESMRTNNAASAPWHSYRSNIVSVNAVQTISPEIMNYWFYDMSNCTSMDLKLIESNGTYICTFSGCSSLITLNISNFESSSNMRDMFSGMDSLEKITLGEDFMFTTLGNVYNDACLPEGNWKHVETGNVYTSEELSIAYWGADFAGTYEKIPPVAYAAVYGGDTLVFGKADSVPVSYSDKALTESWSKANGYDIENTNYTSYSQVPWYSSYRTVITSVNVIDKISPVSTAYWFFNMTVCTSMDLKLINTTNVQSMNSMFYNCKSLTTLDVSNFDTTNVQSMHRMFETCSGLTSLNLLNFNTTEVTNMEYMFEGCTSLTSIDVSSFNTDNVTSMFMMFYNCKSLTTLNLSNFNNAKVRIIESMFHDCTSLTSLNLSNFGTTNVMNMKSIFDGCSSLTSLDLSSFNTTNVTNMSYMFDNCYVLTTIYASDLWSTDAVTSSDSMFSDCTKLKGDIAYNSSYVDKTYAKTSGGYLTYKAA